ncbi:unnamed protein product [Cyclocybe aegerita]|uniref:Ketosynthase family 3 (KS3) domain-containing protein n=1 Tax=Cyclocybe aegerita TaxID=1973307 RepID=A0A8S0VR27_CYCAE|nr:unnamed protein product [Cyclocybe aegerita]
MRKDTRSNSTTNTMSTYLPDIFLRNAERFPDHDFLVEDKQSTLSYAQAYFIAVGLLPNRLLQLHPSLAASSHSNVIVILSPNNSLVPLAMFALWELGAKVVPLSTVADPSLWAGMINLVNPDLILVASSLRNSLLHSLKEFGLHAKYSAMINISSLIPKEHLSPFFMSTDERVSNYAPSFIKWLDLEIPNFRTSPFPTRIHSMVQSDTPAITLFTSSAIDWLSLKCVTYTHEMLAHSGRRAMLMLGGSPYKSKPKRHLGWLPLSHCFEFCITFCGVVLQTAGAYIFFDRILSSPEASSTTRIATFLLAGLEYYAPVTAFAATPAIFNDIIAQCGQNDIERLRALDSVGIGGAPTIESVFQWAASNNITYFDCSGATEAAGTIAIRRTADVSQRKNGLQVIPELMGMLQKESTTDTHGELIIKGKHLPIGYDYRETEAYSFDTVTGVTTYRTGDLYSHPSHIPAFSFLIGDEVPDFDADRPALSGLTYLGRIDDMIVLKSGIKIDALAFERVLDSLPHVERSAIMPNTTGDAIIALIQPHTEYLSHLFHDTLINSVLEVNISIAFEKRLRRECIFLVNDLPTTTKHTLNRKMLKKILKECDTDDNFARRLTLPSDIPPVEFSCSSVTSTTRVRLARILSHIYSIPESHFADRVSSLSDIPLTSLSAIKLAQALHDEFSVNITAAQLYAVHNIEDLCHLLIPTTPLTEVRGPLDPASSDSEANSNKIQGEGQFQEIVATGAACRFAGGIDSMEAYWSALLSPDIFVKNLSRTRPESRWPKGRKDEASFFPMGWLNDSEIDNLKSFRDFFGLSPKEGASLSPNARLVMQLGYQSIEDACIAPKSLSGQKWGIFTAVNDSGWRERRLEASNLEEYAIGLHGSADDAVGARLAYFLNFTGPTIEIKTACSSSAVAIHQACMGICNGDCEAAVVITVSTHFHPAGALFRAHNGITSPSGVCAPFSESADGFVASEGACAIVLQKAPAAKIQPYGCILASAITQDGASRGFFAPNPNAQTRLLREVLSKAGISASQISFVEAHDTGTRLGDSIELEALQEAFCNDRIDPICIGSSKAVIGHTEECAGLAGTLKVLLCLHHNAIPPQPRTGPFNSTISTGRVHICRKISPFVHGKFRRYCSVSSFGLSGTLANIVIGETSSEYSLPPAPPALTASPIFVFVISAKSGNDLCTSISRYLEFFSNQHLSGDDLEAAARTTQVARDHLSVRFAWIGETWTDLIQSLRAFRVDKLSPPPLPRQRLRVGLWFGVPFFGVATANKHPLCESLALEMSHAMWSTSYKSLWDQLIVALALRSLGCEISAVGGDGMGEYVAAIFAGTIAPTTVFRVVDEGIANAVHPVRCSATTLTEFLVSHRVDELKIMGRHGPDLFTVGGKVEHISALANVANATVGVRLPPPTIIVPPPSFPPPSVPIISSHTGSILDQEALSSFPYWSGVQQREASTPVALQELQSQCDVVVNLTLEDEIVRGLGDRCLTGHGNSLERIVGGLYQRGSSIEWEKFSSQGRLLRLPGYCWSMDERGSFFEV